MSVSPVSVSEDESAEFQVSQHNSVAMAVLHSVQHLSKQEPRLLLAQALPAADVSVHVAMVTRQEDIHAVLAHHDVQQATDVVVVTEPSVSSQPLLVTA